MYASPIPARRTGSPSRQHQLLSARNPAKTNPQPRSDRHRRRPGLVRFLFPSRHAAASRRRAVPPDAGCAPSRCRIRGHRPDNICRSPSRSARDAWDAGGISWSWPDRLRWHRIGAGLAGREVALRRLEQFALLEAHMRGEQIGEAQ